MRRRSSGETHQAPKKPSGPGTERPSPFVSTTKQQRQQDQDKRWIARYGVQADLAPRMPLLSEGGREVWGCYTSSFGVQGETPSFVQSVDGLADDECTAAEEKPRAHEMSKKPSRQATTRCFAYFGAQARRASERGSFRPSRNGGKTKKKKGRKRKPRRKMHDRSSVKAPLTFLRFCCKPRDGLNARIVCL